MTLGSIPETDIGFHGDERLFSELILEPTVSLEFQFKRLGLRRLVRALLQDLVQTLGVFELALVRLVPSRPFCPRWLLGRRVLGLP